jgi:hypothetical protein
MENSLIFQTSPKVTIATNTFVNVPVILKYEDVNLIEIVREERVGFTTQIPIYHQDGTHLAKVTGNRLYLSEDGKKTGLKIDKYEGLWVCTMDKKTLFEIQQQTGDAFKTTAELYTPDGYFVKCTDAPAPHLIDTKGSELKIGGMIMSGNTISGFQIGIWLRRDGSCAIGVNA